MGQDQEMEVGAAQAKGWAGVATEAVDLEVEVVAAVEETAEVEVVADSASHRRHN